MKYTEILLEGRDAPLYHGTNVGNAISILQEDAIENKTQHKIPVDFIRKPVTPKEKKAYSGTKTKTTKIVNGVSLTRNMYFSWNAGEIIFVIDQRKLSQTNKLIPLEYWWEGSSYSNRGEGDTESEEFCVGSIDPLSKYLVKIYGSKKLIKQYLKENPQYKKQIKVLIEHPLFEYKNSIYESVELIEDASSDLDNYKLANEVKSKLIQYLMRCISGDYGFKMLRFSDGEICITLRGSDIGLTGEDSSLWFRFGKQKNYIPDGHISKFKKSGEAAITVYCLKKLPETIEEFHSVADQIIHNKVASDVLLHELIHYFDNKRHEFIGIGNRDGNKDEDGMVTPKYYNSPHEFNAYYNNLAEPLLTVSNAALHNVEVAKRIAKGLGITENFSETLKHLMMQSRGDTGFIVRNFFENLTPDRKKRLLKRLYSLHYELVKKLGLNELT